MKYILYLDWGALTVYLVIMLSTVFKKNIRTQKSVRFHRLLLSSFFAVVFDIVSTFAIENVHSLPLAVNYILNMLYLLTFNISTPLFLSYVLTMTGRRLRMSWLQTLLMYLPFFVSAGLILSTPFSRAVFYFDEQRIYSHGAYMLTLYLIAELYLLCAFWETLKNRKYLALDQRISSYVFMGGSMAAVLIQYFIPELLMVQFAVSISVLLLYLAMQNPENYYDQKADALNRNAFLALFHEKCQAQKPMDVVALRISGLDYLGHTLGWRQTDRIMRTVSKELQALSDKAQIFRLEHGKYAFLADHAHHIYGTLPNKILARFSQPFAYNELSVPLRASTCCISYPEVAKTTDEMLSMIEYYLEAKTLYRTDTITWGEKQVVEAHVREEKLLFALQDALVNNGFTVLYQPLYNPAKGSFTSAEALVRLKETGDMGFVSPEEFIPLAEKNGLIIQIGEAVLHQVCDFLRVSCPNCIQNIHINLSVVQCMQVDLHERLSATIDDHGIDHSRISFEITETSAAYSTDVLRNNMEKLISAGFQFALDDYGSGFSGTGYLIDYPFAVVKLDKHIVWEAFKSAKAMSVLRNTAHMIREMQMELVAEGVETPEQARVLSEIGCNLLQGYLYAKPIPKDQLLTFLAQQSPA